VRKNITTVGKLGGLGGRERRGEGRERERERERKREGGGEEGGRDKERMLNERGNDCSCTS
jgi:hypothetical protein